jgi:hypothetical protein
VQRKIKQGVSIIFITSVKKKRLFFFFSHFLQFSQKNYVPFPKNVPLQMEAKQILLFDALPQNRSGA